MFYDTPFKKMGLFSVSYQILNSQGLTKTQFKKQMNELMKKKGYVPAKEDEDGISFSFLLSSDKRWISFAIAENSDSEVFGDGKEAEILSRALHTYVIRTEIVDSDFAELALFEEGEKQGTLILGNASGYMDGESQESNTSKWISLLNEDVTLDQLNEIQKSQYAFAEDALADLGELIGLFGEEMFDHKQIKEHDNAFVVKYKKAGAKIPSIERIFKDTFGECLKNEGFVVLKTKRPYLGRIVNNEVVQLISYEVKPGFETGYMDFILYAGIGTIYKGKYDLDSNNMPLWMDWMKNVCFHLDSNNTTFYDVGLFLEKHRYKKNDFKEMKSAVNTSLSDCKVYYLPLLSGITKIQDCKRYLEYSHEMGLANYDYAMKSDNMDESLLLYVLYENDSFYGMQDKNLRNYINNYNRCVIEGKCKKDYANIMIDKQKHKIVETINAFNDVKNSKIKMQSIYDEMKRRKEKNNIMLKKYGFVFMEGE